jgi:phosphatidylglycerophosphate synthase
MFAAIADAYRRTQKPKDIFWNKYVARPLAAVLLVPLARSSITPNQITFASLFVFAGAIALLVAVPGYQGLLLGVAVIELSYVLDCADGQLARLRGTSSPVGAHLDFLMDELKAFLLVGACGVRLWWEKDVDFWMLEGLVGVVIVASAISLTTFVRRPEYVGSGPRPASAGDYGDGFVAQAPARRGPMQLVEALGKFLIHYPSYLVYVAIFNRLDLFLHVYVVINAAHAARSFLAIIRKLGRQAS